MKLISKNLKVSHYPNVPCMPFEVEVSNEIEASKIVKVLAEQHLWLFDNGFIPDYSNAIVVTMFEEGHEDEDDNGWVDYWNDDEGMEWDEFEEAYLKDQN